MSYNLNVNPDRTNVKAGEVTAKCVTLPSSLIWVYFLFVGVNFY